MKKSHDNLTEMMSLMFDLRRLMWQHKLKRCSPDPREWARMQTLRYVAEMGEPTMQDIARYLRITAPSATSIIDHLETVGLLSRYRAGGDRRVVRVRITKKGEKSLATYRDRAIDTMKEVFAVLPDSDVAELGRILKRLHDTHRA